MQRVESRGPRSSREEECEGLSVGGTSEGGQSGRVSELGSEPPPEAWWARGHLHCVVSHRAFLEVVAEVKHRWDCFCHWISVPQGEQPSVVPRMSVLAPQ